MRAYEIQEFGIENLKIVNKEMPAPSAGEVLIRVHATSINFRDLMVIEGKYNPRMKLPAIPFSDGAGEIVGVGEGVTRWSIGDRVCPIFAQGWFDGEPDQEKSRTALGAGAHWNGVLREYAVFSEKGVVAFPEHLSYEEAATLPCAGITAWNALVEGGKLKAGETVLTLGTGGVSIFAVQFAKMLGAAVISTSSSDAKLMMLRDLGVEHTINYRETENWDATVLEVTGGRGVDHVVEVGGSGTLKRSVNAARFGGHVALIGALTEAGDFSHVPVFMKSVRLQGIFTGSRRMFEDMNRAIQTNQMRPVIDRTFGFEEVAEALRYMQSGSHFGKIVISF